MECKTGHWFTTFKSGEGTEQAEITVCIHCLKTPATISLESQLAASEQALAAERETLKVCGTCKDYSHENCKCYHDYAGQELRAPQSKCEHPESGWRKVDWL